MNAQKLIDAVIAFRLNPGPVTAQLVLLEEDRGPRHILLVPEEWQHAVAEAVKDANAIDACEAPDKPDIQVHDEVEIIWPLDTLCGARGIVEAKRDPDEDETTFLRVRWYDEESTILVDRDSVSNHVRAWTVKTVWRRQDHPRLLEAIWTIGAHGEPGKRLQAARYLLAVVSGWPERIYNGPCGDGPLLCWATKDGVLRDAQAVVEAADFVTPNPGTSPDGGGAQEGLMPDTDSDEKNKDAKLDPKAKKGDGKPAKPEVDVNDERLPEAFRGSQQPAWVEGFLARLAYKGDDARGYAATHRVKDAEWQAGWHKCNKLNFGGR